MEYDYDYFISYAHADNKPETNKPGFVDEFAEKLKNSPEHQQMFGEEVSVFFDKNEIHSMSDWDNCIRSSLSKSRFFIALLSPSYFKSEYCAKEFDWWMQHEMHRRALGEGTAPMLIVTVNDLYNYNVNQIPDLSKELYDQFPNWVKQIRQIQSGPDFDMHNLERAKIDEILRSLFKYTKDKYFKQKIAEASPINAGYPQYNENFVGRRENLRSLRQTLSTKSRTAISAVNGLGGIGKTELALTYGHAFAWDYELGRIFVTCENSNSLEDAILSSSIAEMHKLKLEGTNEQQLTTLYNALKRKIKLIEERNKKENISRTLGTHVLLILDNVNRLELISQDSLDKLPDFFHVIITTREAATEFPHIHTESVGRLSEDESVELLSNHRPFGDDRQEAVAARNIAKLLDGFTLAVELTGAYLKKTPYITYKEQYELLKTNLPDAEKSMVDQTQNLRRHQPECISEVLKSSLSALSDNARKALNFAALMPPDAIGFGWLPELIGLDENEVEGRKVLNELTGYCLLTPLGRQPKIARIHRLVAETVKQEIPEDVQKEMSAKIRDKCNDLLHKDETFWFTTENSWNITPVSEFCLELAKQWTIETSEQEIDWIITIMLDISGTKLKSLGKMNETRVVHQRCYEIRKERVKTFSESIDAQLDLNTSYYFLGLIEISEGNTIVARKWYEKALEISKRLVDMAPDDVNVQRDLSASYNHLGYLENLVGNTPVARDLYEKALENNKRLADRMPVNVDVQRDLSDSYNNLGELEKTARKFAAARIWFEKALEIRKRLADKMPDNITVQRDLRASYNKLGDLEKTARKFAAARIWFEKALEILKRLADKMPDNVTVQRDLRASYNNLGDLEKATRNIAAARKRYENAMQISKRLADKMPNNVDAQRDLSGSYKALGDLERVARNATVAREWYEKAREILQRLADLMPDDFLIQQTLSALYMNFGDLEYHSGNYALAHKWFEKARGMIQPFAEKSPEYVSLQMLIKDLKYIWFHSIPFIAIALRCIFVFCIVNIVIILVKRLFFKY